ncbi:MAG: hypothetical protein L0387_16750 [Acidobacteria bacterium]|nr:hypothetical protein [Acidobacteriota bacterium]
MKTTRIARILELLGAFIPGVYELSLLLPAFFGLHSAARAIGFDLDLGPEVVAVISVTFSCLLWMIFSSLAYDKPHRPSETTSAVFRGRDPLSASPRLQPWEVVQVNDSTGENRLKHEADSLRLSAGHGEAHAEENHAFPAGFP